MTSKADPRESRKIRVAFIATDNREHRREYGKAKAGYGTAPAALLDGFANLPEVEIHLISCLRQPVKSQEKLAENIWIHSLHVPRLGWIRTGYQGCIRAVRQKLRELRPDIVHGQGTEMDCAMDAVFSKFPNVITLHGNMRQIARLMKAKPFSFHWLAARLEAVALPRAGGVVCISGYAKQAVSGLARRTWVIPNAVDSTFFAIKAEPSRVVPPRVLCVGLITQLKNQNAFIRSVDRLGREGRFELVFLGELLPNDPYGAEFLELVRARSWCTHAGFADRNQLKEHLRQASLLVLPSHEENCPMSVLEAMAAGRPVVASKIGGVPDLIEEGETGCFCDPTDGASMSAAVERILTNPSLADEMGQRAKKRALSRFHPEVIARRHLEVYRELLSTFS